MREWAVLAGKGWLLLSGSVVLASLKAPVKGLQNLLSRTQSRQGRTIRIARHMQVIPKASLSLKQDVAESAEKSDSGHHHCILP